MGSQETFCRLVGKIMIISSKVGISKNKNIDHWLCQHKLLMKPTSLYLVIQQCQMH